MTKSRNILPPRIPFGPEEDAIIRDLFPINATRKVAKLIDRTEGAVSRYAERHGIKKSPEYLAEKACRRNGHEPASVAHRFKLGQAPPNKGLRRPGYAPGRMAQTQFRKGQMAGAAAAKYVPIGTERFDTKRGVVIRKLSDDQSIYPAARWRPVHVLVWEAVNGPVPEGMVCVFRPGMKTLNSSAITVDRLEVVSRPELMRRNTRHRFPPELNQLLSLKAALTRKINRRTKGEPA